MNTSNDSIELNIKATSEGATGLNKVISLMKSFPAIGNRFGSVMDKISGQTSSATVKINKLGDSARKVSDDFQNKLFRSLDIKPTVDISGFKEMEKEMNNLTVEQKKKIDEMTANYNDMYKSWKLNKNAKPMMEVNIDGERKVFKYFENFEKYMQDYEKEIERVKQLNVTPKMDINKLLKNTDDAKKAIISLQYQMEEALKKGLPIDIYENGIKSIEKRFGILREDIIDFGDKTEKSTTRGSKGMNLFGRAVNSITRSLWNATKWLGKFTLHKIFGVIPGLGKKVGDTTDTLFKKFKKLGLGLLSVRTAMSLLTKAVSAYMSFDSALQSSISNSWNMLGSLLAPAIELVANLFAKATNYVYQFVKALTGIDLVARANAKALTSQASATKAAGMAQRSLTGMDEITNLQTESAGGGGTDIPQIETMDIDANGFLSKIIDAIKAGDWYLVGETIADGLNTAMESIPWEKVRKASTQAGKNVTNLLNGFVDNFNWKLMGSTIGNAINTAIDFAYELVTGFHWATFGKGLADGLMGAITTIDWSKLAETINNGILGLLRAARAFVNGMDWNILGQKIREMVTKINYKEIWNEFTGLMSDAFKGFSDFMSGLFDIDQQTADKITATVLGIGVAILGTMVIFKLIDPLLKKFSKSGKSAGDVASTLGNDFGAMLKSLGKATEFIALLGGIALALNSVAKVIKAFGDSGKDVGEIALLLGTVFGTLTISVIAMSKAVGSIPVSGLIGLGVILGGLTAILLSVSAMFDSFAKSGMSANDVIGIMLTIFSGLAVIMALVATLGPAMTAGLVPFLAVVAGISAILLVMAATLPTILDAVGDFIVKIAPVVIKLLEVIGDKIERIILALGKTLPPIIREVGNLFDKVLKGIDNIFRTVFNGISQVIRDFKNLFVEVLEKIDQLANTVFNGMSNLVQTVGNVIINIMNTAKNLVKEVLQAILDFINQLGPAINNFVNNAIAAVTKLINFIVSAIEFAVNSTVVAGINAMIGAINKIPGVNIKKATEVHFKRFAPKLETGTNEIPREGIYHLHPGEAVVPKKYNPATGGYNDGADNKQMIDLLISLNQNVLALSEKDTDIYMNGRKVAEAMYDDMETVRRNKNTSRVVKRS